MNKLDIVLFVLGKHRKTMSKMHQTAHKQIGKYRIRLSKEEKATMIQEQETACKRLVSEIYEHINNERKSQGYDPLINPLERNNYL